MSEQVRASHILVSHNEASGTGSQLTKDDAYTHILKIKEEIEGGSDFAAMAVEHSDCPSSGQGGDLGRFGRGMMVPEFDQAVFDLDVDQMSDVVETDFGYHLIHRTE